MTSPAQDGPAGPGTGSPQPAAGGDGLLVAARSLSRYHREHEKYYSEAPLNEAVSLQRMARTLIALAERWTSAEPAAAPAPSPFAGTPDLNDERAIETSGVLFMEGGGEPAELTRMKSDLEAAAATGEQTGAWLASAMEGSWAMAEALLGYPQLADLLAERHKIISNNWRTAFTAQLIARCLRRAVDARLSVRGGRADQPRRRPVGRQRHPHPRGRAPVADLPPADRADHPGRLTLAG